MRILDRRRRMYEKLGLGFSYEEVASAFGVTVEKVKQAEARFKPFEKKARVSRNLKEKREVMMQYYLLKQANPKIKVIDASKQLGVDFRDLQVMVSTIYKVLEPQFKEELAQK